MTVTIKLRRGLASEWLSIDPVLLNGEPGFEYDTGKLKIGDGSSTWSALSYVSASGGGGGSSAWGDLTGIPANLSNIGGLTTASGDIIIASGNHLFHVVNLAESIDDRTAQLLVGGSGISLSYNDAGNSLTVSATGLALSSHTHTSSNITDFTEATQDVIGASGFLVAGTGTSITYNDSSNTLTFNNTSSPRVVTTVLNKTGSQIPKFSAVYINGGQGDQATVNLALAVTDATSSKTYGITAANIDHMGTGEVVVLGSLTGVNTDQFNPTAPTGDVNGTTLWLSPTTSGAITSTKPSAPYHMVAVGTVVRTHQNAGVVEVRIQNGYELEELHNVKINGVASGQALVYNSANTLWENKTLTASLISDFNTSVSGLLPSGSSSFQITTVDLHNGGVQNAQVLQFNNGSYQSVITGPTPASGNSSQRIIVQGQRAQGNGEGGDVYLWGGDADYNGGDIKIYAGDADNSSPSNGYGGYVNIDGGRGITSGGDVEITAGYSESGQAGDVNIVGGPTATGVAGNVTIKTNNSINTWTFDINGNLNIPGNITLPNNSTIASGTYDNNTSGYGGISLNCVVGYELNWQGGHLKSTYNNGANIANILCDSPIEFPGSGVANMQINNSGITFPDGSTQTSAGGSSGPTVVSLTFATTLNTDASAGDIFDITLTDNVTLANPTNPTNGKTLRWRIKQDNTGGRTVALGNKFVIPTSASSPLDFSTSGNAIDLLGATYYSSSDKWHIVAFVPGYV